MQLVLAVGVPGALVLMDPTPTPTPYIDPAADFHAAVLDRIDTLGQVIEFSIILGVVLLAIIAVRSLW